MNYSVYLLKFPNNKVYVGQTKKLVENRLTEHKWDRTNSKNNLHRPIIFAMRKYKELVVCETLESNLTLDEANFLEKYYIKYYNSIDINFGYNLCIGGNAGNIMSEAGKKRRAEKMQKYYKDPEYIARISASHRNRKHTIKDFCKKQKEIIDKYFSKVENRIKHSKIKGGKPFICIETGEVFESLALAGEKLNCYGQNIRKVLLKERKQTNNLTFKYVEGR